VLALFLTYLAVMRIVVRPGLQALGCFVLGI